MRGRLEAKTPPGPGPSCPSTTTTSANLKARESCAKREPSVVGLYSPDQAEPQGPLQSALPIERQQLSVVSHASGQLGFRLRPAGPGPRIPGEPILMPVLRLRLEGPVSRRPHPGRGFAGAFRLTWALCAVCGAQWGSWVILVVAP